LNTTDNITVSFYIKILSLAYLIDSPSFIFNRDGVQESRDKRKQIVAKEAGITLVVIPYWWRFSEEYLRSNIALKRPDLFPGYTPRAYHIEPPTKMIKEERFVPSRGKKLVTEDPTGW
jgi:hypothetical protein